MMVAKEPPTSAALACAPVTPIARHSSSRRSESGRSGGTVGQDRVRMEMHGTATEFADVIGDKITGHGIFVETLANGDKIHVTYEFQGTSKDKVFQMGSN